MTDPTNPLMTPGAKGRGRVTVEMLHEMAADLNRKRFVQGSGWQYFVNLQEDADGTPGKHFLDRRNVAPWPPLTPQIGRRIP